MFTRASLPAALHEQRFTRISFETAVLEDVSMQQLFPKTAYYLSTIVATA